MHIEIRLFPGTAGQGGRFAARRSELDALLGATPGLRSADLAETREGVVLVTVADEPGALPEAHRRFAEWVAERLPDLGMNEAFSVSGPVISRREA